MLKSIITIKCTTHDQNRIFYIIAAILLLISIYTNFIASVSYPAWSDEAIFGDLIYNYTYNNIWAQDVWWEIINIWMYGPIYFKIQKLLVNLFGFHAHVIRSVDAFATYLLSFLIFKICFIYTKNQVISIYFFILFILDYSVNRAVALGRFDMLSTLFSMLGFLYACRVKNMKLIDIILSGFFLSCSFLTTFRSIFLLPGPILIILYYFYNNLINYKSPHKILLSLLIFLIIIFIPIYLWVNSLGGWSIYLQNIFTSNIASRHKGISFFRIKLDFLLYPLFFLFLYNNSFKIFRDIRFLGIILNILLFTFFVKEVGPYRSMIIGYIYIAFALMLQNLILDFDKIHLIKFSKYYSALIFFISLITFSFRSLDILLINKKCRSTPKIEKFLWNNIRPNSVIASGYEYFYLLRPHVKKYISLNNLTNNLIKINTYPDYIILNEIDYNETKFQKSYFFSIIKQKYNQIAYYNCKTYDFGYLTSYLSRRSYEGTRIYSLNK